MSQQTIFEDLSNELFREIFRYLSIQEQFSAFYNLNQRLDRCILTDRCHLTVKGSDRSSDFFLENILPLATSCDHINRLRLENIRRNQCHPNLTRLHIPHLRSLTLINICVNETILALLRAHTEHLEYLDMSKSITSKWDLLFEYVLSLPKLKQCRLMLGIALFSPKTPITSRQSNQLEHLSVVNSRMDCPTDALARNLTQFPHLKTLRLTCSALIIPLQTCQYPSSNLTDFTIELNHLPVAFVQLTDFLVGVSPNLENFTLRSFKPISRRIFLITSRWSDLFDQLPRLKHLTLDFPRRTSFDEKIWNHLCEQLKNLTFQRTIQFDFYSKCVI